MLDFSAYDIMKFKQQNCLILVPLILISTLDLVCCQASIDDCVLDIQFLSSLDSSNCKQHTWGGFLNSCCGLNFGDYLYALGLQANQTGEIFLNSSEQKACLSNFTGCGIEKLTSGAGACSDYTVNDAINNLGDNLRRIDEDCMSLSTQNGSCGVCSRRWEEITATSDSADTGAGANLCRFAVLVSLTSFRIYDRQSIEAVYECLGTQSLPAVLGKQEGKASSGNAKRSPGLWILSFGLAGVTVIVVLLAAWTFFRKRTRSHPTETDAHRSEFEDSTCPNLTVKEVYVATNNLNASNFIGEGIAGKVYKGILPNGQHVAVKHITNEGYLETFARELRSLRHVRHPNLVALLGYCENEDECFLVYELCHKGNLSKWLFGKDNTLSWIQRLEIAVDSARGLAFLHNYSNGCIVHRDIKPSNVLIDANFRAKLSDFGLSRVMDVGQSYVSSEVRGTFGYIDPEYRRNHHVNASGDVYSFGIVLLQLLSGQRVMNFDLQRPMPLNKMAITFARGERLEFADPRLKGEFSVEAFDITLKLALSCIGLKQQRPSIKQVLYDLEKALEISIHDNHIHLYNISRTGSGISSEKTNFLSTKIASSLV